MSEQASIDKASGNGAAVRFCDLPMAATAVWAKSNDGTGHGLLAHMLDVAAVAERLLDREPMRTRVWAAQQFGCQPALVGRWLAWLAGQHDLGKATVGFQAKWPSGRAMDEAAGLSFPARLLGADQHDLHSAHLLGKRLRRELASAVAAHHGFHFDPTEISRARLVGEPPIWGDARTAIAAAYDAALGSPHHELTQEPPLSAINWLAGLTSVADWIGSNTDWFPTGIRSADIAGHHARALELADSALDAIGWPRAHSLLMTGTVGTADLLARMTGQQGMRPRPLQQAADDLLNQCGAPALLIVEAPMGEGKTELAFLAHLRLQANVGHRGLYIGLPTQATGNAMFDRALRFLRSFQPDQSLDLQLAHGAAALDERLVELRGIHGDRSGVADAVHCSAWFAQKRRALISPYGVGTVDQALYATLNVKHHFVRLTAIERWSPCTRG